MFIISSTSCFWKGSQVFLADVWTCSCRNVAFSHFLSIALSKFSGGMRRSATRGDPYRCLLNLPMGRLVAFHSGRQIVCILAAVAESNLDQT